MDDDNDDGPGIPEWVVTFGDMMSLLLTFFIMLVSLSEIKEEETYQALVDSVQQQFGYNRTVESLSPGETKPRTSAFKVLATEGRAKRKDTSTGGVPQKAPHGEERRVRIVRPGSTTSIGSVIFFDVASNRLNPEAARTLEALAEQLRGKPQKIEIRGHVSSTYAARVADNSEAFALGFRRAEAVRGVLVDRYAMDPARFRIATAGDAEPIGTGGGGRGDSRVEVFLLDETADAEKP